MNRVAISIKQPWATLIVFGIKSLEVRRWSTNRTGEIYIHTGKKADTRDEGWKLIGPEMHEWAELRGGLIGKADLVRCREYHTPTEFARDLKFHWNPQKWFQPPRMYAFEFTNPRRIEFEALKGSLYFFEIGVTTSV